MKVEELYNYGMPEKAIEIIKKKGINEFFPPQEEALRKGLLNLEKNFVIAVPTASGKTLIGEMLIIKNLIDRGGKALYIVPLKALGAEKFDELKAYEPLGLKVALTTGDYDTGARWLEGYDIIITTSEKADSLIRHRPSWINKISCVVADEIHLINDASRGATLEVTIARLLHINKNLRLLALSATVGNAREVANWLDAKLITSDWRPVELKEGIYLDGKIIFSNSSSLEIENSDEPALALALDTVNREGQSLIFINTRRGTESFAVKAAKKLKGSGIIEEKLLKEISQEILHVLPEPTKICRKLAKTVEGGSAFHHAGLETEQKKIVERAYKKNLIKILSATPTLAAGVNLPARRVVVREYRRYDSNYGYVELPVMEIKQMLGRAGRPKYDSFGEAILIARSDEEKDFLLDNYILAEPENIYSKLAIESSLRTHTLATFAMGYASNTEELLDFFSKTFFGYQQESYALEALLDKIVEFLTEKGFLENGSATEFGKRTSELYIDPMSALILKNAIEVSQEKPSSEFSFLHAITKTSELNKLYLRKKDYDMCIAAAGEMEDFLLFPPPSQYSDPWGYEDFLSEIKTTLFFMDWIKERNEDFLLTKYNLAPGDIRSRVEAADWLLYSMDVIARLFGFTKIGEISELRLRVKHGIGEELIPFVGIKGIGRVRARKLYNKFKTIEDIKKASIKEIASVALIGNKLAQSIKAQLGGEEEEVKITKMKQSTLTGF
ncbi:ski2-like helicase [archaeon BMS3Bbin15]|nr:ski2-like helicase [archaeon BMS3Bbin15]